MAPTEEFFRQFIPKKLKYSEFDQIWYPLARFMLGAAPVPDDILATPTYQGARTAIADALRTGLSVTRLDGGFDYNIVRQELAGLRPPSTITGQYALTGVNSGAKNSVDRNYIAQAQATGFLDVRALHEVVNIQRLGNAGYRVFVREIDELGNVLRNFSITTCYLFMGAGSMGTTKLLLKANASGALGKMPKELGQNWGTNGDDFRMRFGVGPVGLAMGGPPAVLVEDRNNTIAPVAIEYAGGSQTPGGQDFLFKLGIAGVRGFGSLRYDAATDSVVPFWPPQAQQLVQAALDQTYQILANATPGSVVMPAENGRPSTYHPLGGAIIGKVCSENGEVNGQSSLFVVDGSLLDGSTGLRNPALTITALAERCMDRIISKLKL